MVRSRDSGPSSHYHTHNKNLKRCQSITVSRGIFACNSRNLLNEPGSSFKKDLVAPSTVHCAACANLVRKTFDGCVSSHKISAVVGFKMSSRNSDSLVSVLYVRRKL